MVLFCSLFQHLEEQTRKSQQEPSRDACVVKALSPVRKNTHNFSSAEEQGQMASVLRRLYATEKNAMWLQEVYFKLLQNFSPRALCLAADDTKKNVIYSSYFVVASRSRVGVFVRRSNIMFFKF